MSIEIGGRAFVAALSLAFAIVSQVPFRFATAQTTSSEAGPSGGDAASPAATDPSDVVTAEELREELENLRERLEALEADSGSRAESDVGDVRDGEVDLSDEDVAYGSLDSDKPSHPLARDWFENITISGFGAAGFLMTGNDGLRPDGGFLIKEASLFVEAETWEDIFFFAEVQTNRLGKDDDLFVRTGEVHAHFRNVLKHWGDGLLGIKVGRIDIPFGEEYLWQDASDNPLITNSAAYPYGFDEGVLFYGKARGLGWLLSVTDGDDTRSLDDDPDKAINLKLYGNVSEDLYVSASLMRNGRVGKSAFEFGGSHFQPVGAGRASSAGTSGSRKVDAYLYELDAKYSFGDAGYVALSFGQAFVDDNDSTFDRDLLWFSAEGLVNLTPTIYAVARYSEIGTYNAGEGYHFDGKITAGGNAAFGYDTRRFRRVGVGLGWKPNPRVILKGELGADFFKVIDVSPFSATDDDRWLAGAELVLVF